MGTSRTYRLIITAVLTSLLWYGTAFAADTDGDGVADDRDYCVGDGAYDIDGDGLCSGDDNCPFVANPDQNDDVCANGVFKYSHPETFSGSYYEIGRQIAHAYKDAIIDIGFTFAPGFEAATVQQYYDAIEDMIPQSIKDHMEGMTMGLTEIDPPLSPEAAWDMVLVNGLFIEQVNKLTFEASREFMGCTAFAVTSDAGTFLAHNTDNQKGTEGHNAIMTIIPDNGDNAYMHFFAPAFVDAALGINDKGIAMTYNVGRPNTYAATGLPPLFMERYVLEKASTLDEAIGYFESFLEEGHNFGFSSSILLLVDFKDGSMAKLQVRSEKIKVTPGQLMQGRPDVTYVATTNHFDEDFRDDPDYYYESSWKRYKRLMELLPTFDTYDLDACLAILTDHGDGEASNNTISRDGPSTVTTITNIFTSDGSYYTIGVPHRYMAQYGEPQYVSLNRNLSVFVLGEVLELENAAAEAIQDAEISELQGMITDCLDKLGAVTDMVADIENLPAADARTLQKQLKRAAFNDRVAAVLLRLDTPATRRLAGRLVGQAVAATESASAMLSQ